MSPSPVQSVLTPSSVAVIGASPSGHGFTSAPLTNLARHGYSGNVYAVNPRYDEINGVKCFPDLTSLPAVPETAVIVLGASRVLKALEDCASVGVKSATVIAGGFAELGDDGLRMETEIRSIVEETGIRIVGPNTAGLMNVIDHYVPRAGVNHPKDLTPGGIAIATQSGALCNTLANRVLARGNGLSYAVATGSQWDLDMWDFVEFFVDDDRTRAILTVVEGLKDPERFLHVAHRAASADKPIILMKVGRSALGQSAVQTHSGALAGAADVQFSIMREHGVIVVDDLDELWEVGQLFERWGATQRRFANPPRLGIATYSGSDGALAVDAASDNGLDCPQPAPATIETLERLFALATPANPFDYTGEVIGKPELIAPATAAILDDPNFDLVLVASPAWTANFASSVLGPAVDAMAARPGMLGAVSMWSAGQHTSDAEILVHQAGIPLFDGTHRAIRAIGRYVEFVGHRDRWAENRSQAVGPAPPPSAGDTTVHPYWQSRLLLADSGVPFNEARLASTAAEAVDASELIGYPVTLKASSSEVVHKAVAGAVHLFLANRSAVHDAAGAILGDLPSAQIVVESFRPSALVAFVGGHRDSEFGPVIVTGLGGAYAEAYGDVTHLRCPASPPSVRRALLRTTFGRMLGETSTQFVQLQEMLGRVAEWFGEHAEVESFDINPVLIGLDGEMVAVDARVETRDASN